MKPDPEESVLSADDLRRREREAVERAAEYHGLPPVPEPDAGTLARLERALLQLPRRTREIFLGHRIDGYSYAKIADMTGLSVKQVTRHMAKALFRISRFLDGDEHTPWQRWRQRHIDRWFR